MSDHPDPCNDVLATGNGFECCRCHVIVDHIAPGTRHRNHCPRCLWSVHLDNRPGDRAAACRGPMEPITVWVRPDGEWAIVHRCRRCNDVCTNRIAGDDNALALISLAVRPLAQPPFPLDRLEPAKVDESGHPH